MPQLAQAPITQTDRDNGFTGEIRQYDTIFALPNSRADRCPSQLIVPETKERIYKNGHWVSETADLDLAPFQSVETLGGRHFFGGFTRVHFGHFLVECLAPIWALDHINPALESVVFFTFHDPQRISERGRKNLHRFTQTMLDQFGINASVTLLYEPTKIENLYVAEPGFGFEKKFAGSTPFQEFFRSRHAAKTPPKKDREGKHVYVSRTKLGSGKGHLIGEQALERTFADAGYDIFIPEDHDVQTQLAVYRNADQIVGVEGSALHLAPLAIHANCQVAILSRRSDHQTIDQSYGRQYKNFAGISPIILGKHIAHFQIPNAPRLRFDCLTVTDFDVLYTGLMEAGFLPPDAQLHYPRPEDLAQRLERSSKRAGQHLQLYNVGL